MGRIKGVAFYIFLHPVSKKKKYTAIFMRVLTEGGHSLCKLPATQTSSSLPSLWGKEALTYRESKKSDSFLPHWCFPVKTCLYVLHEVFIWPYFMKLAFCFMFREATSNRTNLVCECVSVCVLGGCLKQIEIGVTSQLAKQKKKGKISLDNNAPFGRSKGIGKRFARGEGGREEERLFYPPPPPPSIHVLL